MHTDDDTLFKYQRKLWQELQWSVVTGAPVGAGFAYAALRFTRMFKKASGFDWPLYFGMPFLYWAYCKSMVH
jgi:hypothetical protein